MQVQVQVQLVRTVQAQMQTDYTKTKPKPKLAVVGIRRGLGEVEVARVVSEDVEAPGGGFTMVEAEEEAEVEAAIRRKDKLIHILGGIEIERMPIPRERDGVVHQSTTKSRE